jgi:hypothetical protein
MKITVKNIYFSTAAFGYCFRYVIATEVRLHVCNVDTDEFIVDIFTDDFNPAGKNKWILLCFHFLFSSFF